MKYLQSTFTFLFRVIKLNSSQMKKFIFNVILTFSIVFHISFSYFCRLKIKINLIKHKLLHFPSKIL